MAHESNSAGEPAGENLEQPWLGLLPYSEDDADVFYGRSKETLQLSRLIHRAALTVVFGRSGTGKSSLLNAGVFPKLRNERYLPVWIRLNYSANFSHDQLIRSAIDEAVYEADLECEVLNEPVAEGTETVWEYLHRVEFWDRRNQPIEPVLVFDQFEELFTLGNTRGGDQAFIEELADLAQNYIPQSIRDYLNSEGTRLPSHYSDQRYKIVVTIREDFVARLDGLRKAMPLVMHNRFYLSQMNGEQALDVVLSPAGDLVDASVAREIVQFVSASLQGTPDSVVKSDETQESEKEDLKSLQIEPALLSLVCRELNQRRIDQKAAKITLQQVRGSREDILEGFYESSLEGLETRDRIFIEDRLVTASGFRSTVAVEDAEQAGLSAEDLTTLVNRRLVRREDRLGIPHIELTHDVLTGVVTRSRNERIKLEEAKEKRRQEEEIEAARQRKAKKNLGILASIGLVISVIAILLSYALHNSVKNEKRVAKQLLTLHAIEQEKTDPEVGLLLGIEAALVDFDLNGSSEIGSEIQSALKTATRMSLIRQRFKSQDELIHSVDFHPTKPIALSSSGSRRNFADGNIEFWNVQTGVRLASLDHELAKEAKGEAPFISGAHFNPEGDKVISYRDGAFPRIWDVSALLEAVLRVQKLENEIAELKKEKEPTEKLQGELEVAIREKQRLEKEAPFVSFQGFNEKSDQFTAAAFNPDGTILASGASDASIRLWDPETGQELSGSPLTYHSEGIRSVQFNSDSSQLLATSDDGKATTWNITLDLLSPANPLRVFDPFAASRPDRFEKINGGQFNPSGTMIATVDHEKRLRIWDPESGNILAEFRHPDVPMALDFYRDDRLVTVCNDSTIRFFDVLYPRGIEENLPVLRLNMIGSQRGHKGKVQSVAVSPGKDYILTGGEDFTARLWKEPPGGEIAVLNVFEILETNKVAQRDRIFWSTDIFEFSDDRGLIAFSGNELGQVNAWDVFKEESLPDWKGSTEHKGPIRSLNISPDGTQFVTSSSDQTAILWNAKSGRALAKITGHRKAEGESGRGPVYQARFSNDGKKIVTASRDGIARVWAIPSTFDENELEIQTADLVLSHPSPGSSLVYDARFSPDDKLIVTADYKRQTATLWDAKTGDVLKTLEHSAKKIAGDTNIVLSAAFSPDGDRVVTACGDGNCRVWNVKSGELLSSINHSVSVRSAEYNSDGTMIVTTADDGNTRIWDRLTSRLLRTQKDHSLVSTQARFRVGDSYLLTEGSDGISTVSYMDAWSMFELATQRVTRKLTLKERIRFGVTRELMEHEIPYYENTEPEKLKYYLKHEELSPE